MQLFVCFCENEGADLHNILKKKKNIYQFHIFWTEIWNWNWRVSLPEKHAQN